VHRNVSETKAISARTESSWYARVTYSVFTDVAQFKACFFVRGPVSYRDSSRYSCTAISLGNYVGLSVKTMSLFLQTLNPGTRPRLAAMFRRLWKTKEHLCCVSSACQL
jgi:hypothetical protein